MINKALAKLFKEYKFQEIPQPETIYRVEFMGWEGYLDSKELTEFKTKLELIFPAAALIVEEVRDEE